MPARRVRVAADAATSAPSPIRWRLPVILVLTIVVPGGVIWWLTRAPQAGAVVLVSIDTLRADRLPLYGHATGRTPALDAFADDAVLFERAYAHAPQTLPSHASMFTGLLPFEHGVRDNLGFTLRTGTPTLASMFRSAGYATGGFVSAYVMREETGLAQGFNTYDATFPPMAGDRSPAQVQRAGLDTLTAATAWLGARTNPRFLLFFHIYEPHKPYAPPERYRALEPYDGEVAFSDEIVGRLFDELKRLGLYDAATIVVTADHGEGLGDHGEQEHGLFLYDESVRVPLLVKQPGARGGKTRLTTPVQHIDLVPTLAGMGVIQPPAGLRGRNLLPAMRGEASIAPQGIYAEAMYPRYHFGWSELVSLTDDRYRFIKAPREELYDLERDPRERTNLIAERTQAAQALRSGLDALTAGRGIEAPGAVSDADRERLAALGYVGTASASNGGAGSSLPDPKDKAPILRAYRSAVEAMSARDFPQAATLLAGMLAQDPGMTDGWIQYATVLIRLGRDRDALAAYQRVIALKPDEPGSLLGAASLLVSLGRLDEAAKHAELALAHAPPNAHEMLARVALARKDTSGALAHARAAEQADASVPMTAYVQGLIEYHAGRYAVAVPLLVQARDRFAKRALQPADLRFFIGDALARLERYAEAEQAFNEELSIFPGNLRARAALAMMYQATERPADAERAIATMLTAVPTPLAYKTAADLFRMFGQPARAAAVTADAQARFGKGTR